MWLTLALLWAGDADPAPTGNSVAVQVALIGAIAPILAVIVSELFKRWRAKPEDEPRDGVLAPVEEVPRKQYDELLERFADIDHQLSVAQQIAERDRKAAEARENELEEAMERARTRQEREVDRLRDRLTDEIERRAAAEALLQGYRTGGIR